MPKLRSHIWNHFEDISLEEKKATCKYCNRKLSYKTTISNLKSHIEKKHIGVYEEYCRTDPTNIAENDNINTIKILHDGDSLASGFGNEEVNSGDGDVVLLDGGPDGATIIYKRPTLTVSPFPAVTEFVEIPSTSTCMTNNSIGPPKKRQRMVTSTPGKIGLSEKAQIDNCILKLITSDFQPFSIVENEGFREFTHALNPNYELPTRKTLSNLLTAEYETRLQSAKQMVHEFCNSICLTADCWTSRNLVSYIALTGHFTHTETLEQKSILIRCSALEDTGIKIADELSKIADEWEITHKVNFFVTDNASNMVTAAHLLGWEHYGCYVNKLNLIVQEALNLQNITLTVAKVHKTVAHFKSNAQAKEKLLKYQVNEQNVTAGCAKNLLINMPTRWNSTYLMLQRFSELQEALQATIPAISADLPFIAKEEWQCIDQLVKVLKPIYEVTTIMSAEKHLTASIAVVLTKGLKGIYEQLKNKNYNPSIKDFVKCLESGITTRFKSLESNQTVGICTYLDPRFKEHAFSDRVALTTLKSVIINKVAALLIDDGVPEAMDSPAEDIPSVWLQFDKTVKCVVTPKSAVKKAAAEVEMYLAEAVLSRNACPLQWWREHKRIYPSLFSLFIKYFNVMITSVPCDREFSKAGYIFSDRRTSLTSSKITQIMFLNPL